MCTEINQLQYILQLLYTDTANLVCILGWTALHGAAEGGHLDIVKWLVEKGADDNVKSNYGKNIRAVQCLEKWTWGSWSLWSFSFFKANFMAKIPKLPPVQNVLIKEKGFFGGVHGDNLVILRLGIFHFGHWWVKSTSCLIYW